MVFVWPKGNTLQGVRTAAAGCCFTKWPGFLSHKLRRHRTVQVFEFYYSRSKFYTILRSGKQNCWSVSATPPVFTLLPTPAPALLPTAPTCIPSTTRGNGKQRTTGRVVTRESGLRWERLHFMVVGVYRVFFLLLPCCCFGSLLACFAPPVGSFALSALLLCFNLSFLHRA